MHYLKRFKRDNGIKRVCIIDSSHAMLQYLLLSTEDEIRSTYFFWSKGIPENVKNNFKGMYSNMPLINYRPIVRFLLYHVIVPILWPFILRENIEFWGFNHLHYSPALLRKHHLKLLEDGTLNYYNRPTKKGNEQLLRIMYGYYYVNTSTAGEEELCTEINLTGLVNAPVLKNPKTIVQTFEDLWEKCSKNHKNYVLKIFGLTERVLSELKNCDEILLTEPYSEDFVMKEQEKIDFYTRVINTINNKHLLIKPHPRETTDYKSIFPSYTVLTQKIPMQLLNLCGVKFKIVYALGSTAAFSFPYAIKLGILVSNNNPDFRKKISFFKRLIEKKNNIIDVFELKVTDL